MKPLVASEFRADVVTVFHNDTNRRLHEQLFQSIRAHEPDGGYRLISVDNRRINRGFARACNLGAFHPETDAPMIAFLNPDVEVHGPFLDTARQTLTDDIVITGCRFGKPDHELKIWGVHDWVCGATFFVDRRWFTSVGGFDEQFVWAWEESDLIRTAQTQGKRCQSIALPLHHQSPENDTVLDAQYKRYHFNEGAQRFNRKWGRR